MKNREFKLKKNLFVVYTIILIFSMIVTTACTNSGLEQNTAESNMLSYIDKIEKVVVTKMLEDTSEVKYDGSYFVGLSGSTIFNFDNTDILFHIDVTGDKPDGNEEGTIIVISDSSVVLARLKFGNYYITYEYINNQSKYCSSKDGFLSSCGSGNLADTNSDNYTNASSNNQQDSQQKTNDNLSVSVSKQNALRTAKSYLSVSAFSREGLIEQLEYEKYSNEDAIYAVDNCGANWNEQAVKLAKSYLNISGFSRDGLIEQLEYEGFTNEQAVYGVTQNGL